MKALGRNVIVKPDPVERMSESGIIIPDTTEERPETGIVVSVGDSSEVSVGDRVLFSRYAGQDMVVDGEKLLLLRDFDLLAVVYADD